MRGLVGGGGRAIEKVVEVVSPCVYVREGA